MGSVTAADDAAAGVEPAGTGTGTGTVAGAAGGTATSTSDGSATATPTATTPTGTATAVPRAPRPRGPLAAAGTVVGVIVAVAALVLLVPRPNAVLQPAADVQQAAQRARTELGFDPAVPHGLPTGWTVTMATVMHDVGGTTAWRVGYRAPDGQYLGYVQADKPAPGWEDVQVISGPTTGTVFLGDNVWLIRNRVDRALTNYVLRSADVETIVFGHAGPADIEALARSLQLPPQ